MSCFLYFLPDAPAVVKDLAFWGLQKFDERPLACTQVATPMGRGTIAASTDESGLVKFDQDGQVWRKIGKRFSLHEAWIGYWKDRPPSIDTLARKKQLEGEKVELLDGKKWIVPKLREYRQDDSVKLSYDVRLPTLLDFNNDGDYVIGDVVPQYRAIWDRSIEIADQLVYGAIENGESNLTTKDTIDFAGVILGINYYVSIVELMTLKLVGVGEGRLILRTALDLNGFEARIKNLQSRLVSGGTNSEFGSETSLPETQPATGQPLPI